MRGNGDSSPGRRAAASCLHRPFPHCAVAIRTSCVLPFAASLQGQGSGALFLWLALGPMRGAPAPRLASLALMLGFATAGAATSEASVGAPRLLTDLTAVLHGASHGGARLVGRGARRCGLRSGVWIAEGACTPFQSRTFLGFPLREGARNVEFRYDKDLPCFFPLCRQSYAYYGKEDIAVGFFVKLQRFF